MCNLAYNFTFFLVTSPPSFVWLFVATKAEEEENTDDDELTADAIMSLEPKKTGGPIQKFWDSPEIVTSLESVKGWLSKNAKKVRL